MCLIWYQQLILVYHSPIWIRSLVIWHRLQNLHNVHIDRCKIFACFWNPHLLQKLERILHLEQKKEKSKITAHFKFSCLSLINNSDNHLSSFEQVLEWTKHCSIVKRTQKRVKLSLLRLTKDQTHQESGTYALCS